jgi:uncharacterized membrane protein
MKRTVLLRLAALLIALTAIVIVAAVAYHFGTTNASVGAPVRGMPFRGHMGGADGWGGGGFDPGLGLFGLIAMVAIVVLFFWLLAAFVSPNRGGADSTGPATGDMERLRQLSEMHDTGKLTDEEFTAAKRKTLGLG